VPGAHAAPARAAIAAAQGEAHSVAKRKWRGQLKAPHMPVDHPAALRPAVPLPHLRKLAFLVGAVFTGLALYAARLILG